MLKSKKEIGESLGNVCYCSSPENCKSYKEKRCVLLNLDTNQNCPYGKILKSSNENKNKEKVKLQPVNYLSFVGSDYIYLGLPFLNNYCNPIVDEFGIINNCLMPIKNFTLSNIIKLINYRPKTISGEEIVLYENYYLKMFLLYLKNKFPNLYQELLIELPNIADLEFLVDYTGKLAYLKTLNPGKVKLKENDNIFEWDGEKLFMLLGKNKKLKVEYEDKMVVEIVDNKTVSFLKTKFYNNKE